MRYDPTSWVQRVWVEITLNVERGTLNLQGEKFNA
jgi:hypothetical protein